MVIGLYFGSFNPVHEGHVQVAQSFQKQSGVDQVWWVLSPQNPFKKINELASFEHRSAMVQLALPDLLQQLPAVQQAGDLWS
jgi:nicotinate-nucleotide adenylyltransferase